MIFASLFWMGDSCSFILTLETQILPDWIHCRVAEPQVHCGVESHKNLLVHSHWHCSVGEEWGTISQSAAICNLHETFIFLHHCALSSSVINGPITFFMRIKYLLPTYSVTVQNDIIGEGKLIWLKAKFTFNVADGIQLICWISVQRADCSEHGARGGGCAINTNGGKWGFMERERDPLSSAK